MAWDDADPDGFGEPGDMRYDYKRSRERVEMDRQIAAKIKADQAATSEQTDAAGGEPIGPDTDAIKKG